jgi:hypothetical protein
MPNHSRVRIWAPTPHQIRNALWEDLAATLSASFSTRAWRHNPMPVGDPSDPHSAKGIMAELCEEGLHLVASADGEATPDRGILGCVLGGILSSDLIESYGLGPYGARQGDGLLAYIAVAPSVQGARGYPRAGNVIEDLGPATPHSREPQSSVSLASVLFTSWLELPEVASRRALFVRTRKVIGPVLHLLEKHGFVLQGQFEVDYRGERQDRLVFQRLAQR